MDNKTCTVSGCGRRKLNDKGAIGHKFPTRRLVGLKWVQATGNADLQKLPYETITCKQFFVCRSHFVEEDFFESQTGAVRLRRDAVPTLELPVENVVLNESAGKLDLPEILTVPSPSTPSKIDTNVALQSSSPSIEKLSTSKSHSNEAEVRKSSLCFFEDIPQENLVPEQDEKKNQKIRFYKIYRNLSHVQKQFIDMIMNNSERDYTGRRYTYEQKIIALSIFKRSAKWYRFLHSFLPLPSPSLLKTLLKKMQMDTGVTEGTRRRLREAVKSLKTEKDEAFIVMWDDIILGMGLHYNQTLDKIVGFEDYGNKRTEKYADHALVFMLRSIDTGNTIPVCYYFFSKGTTTAQLLNCIKEVIVSSKDAGINIVASVCDGGSSNQSAINILFQDTVRLRGEDHVHRHGTYIVHDIEIIPLFDPPHMIKCLRNNLLDKDLEFRYNNEKSELARTFAEWKHIITAYEIDVYGVQERRYLPKLTDRHIYPNKIKKTSVHVVTQVISLSLASRVDALAGVPGRSTVFGSLAVPNEGKNTAWFLFFGNKLTDSFSGKTRKDPRSQYRTLLTDSSFHLQFFKEAYQEVSRMRFVDSTTKKPTAKQPPTFKNLKLTLRGLELLWKKLKTLGFKSLKTIHVNQDPLQNFFSQIRDCRVNNRKPNCHQFVGFFKTLVVNNMTRSHSYVSNCMADEGSFLETWQTCFEPSGLENEEHTLPSCTLASIPLTIRSSKKGPLPEKGIISTDTHTILQELKNNIPEINSCPPCAGLIDSTSCTANRRVGGKVISWLEEIHADLISILRRKMSSIYTTVGVGQLAYDLLRRVVRKDRVTCPTHREKLLRVFLRSCITQYLVSTTAYLTAILKGKLSCDLTKKTNSNEFVERAVETHASSLIGKHTFSTLSRT